MALLSPTHSLRKSLRLPGGVWLYRLRLGWLLGNRYLLLTHRGRRTLRTHRVMLPVVRYDPDTGESVVVTGSGDRPDWYRNTAELLAVSVETNGRTYPPTVRQLTSAEAYEELKGYVQRRSRAADHLSRRYGLAFNATDAEHGERVSALRGVAFRPGG